MQLYAPVAPKPRKVGETNAQSLHEPHLYPLKASIFFFRFAYTIQLQDAIFFLYLTGEINSLFSPHLSLFNPVFMFGFFENVQAKKIKGHLLNLAALAKADGHIDTR